VTYALTLNPAVRPAGVAMLRRTTSGPHRSIDTMFRNLGAWQGPTAGGRNGPHRADSVTWRYRAVAHLREETTYNLTLSVLSSRRRYVWTAALLLLLSSPPSPPCSRPAAIRRRRARTTPMHRPPAVVDQRSAPTPTAKPQRSPTPNPRAMAGADRFHGGNHIAERARKRGRRRGHPRRDLAHGLATLLGARHKLVQPGLGRQQ
jgi:hypothetical protein